MKNIISLLFLINAASGYSQCTDSLSLIEQNPNGEHTIFTDIDMDGDEDLLYTASWRGCLYLYLNDGVGNYGPRDTIAVGGPYFMPHHVLVDDLDGDSDKDIVVSGQADKVRLLENTGGLQFVLVNELTMIGPLLNCRDCVSFEDLDNDGLKDLILGPANYGIWSKNMGAFNFTDQPHTFYGGDHVIADVDNNGFPDLIDGTAGFIYVHYNSGAGPSSFGSSTSFGTYIPTAGGAEVEAIDYDSDGDVDILYLLPGEMLIKVFVNDGTGQFPTEITVYNGVNELKHLTLGKVNTDAIFDITFSEKNPSIYATGDIKCLYGSVGAYGPVDTLYTGYNRNKDLTLGDKNSDGIDEVVLRTDSIDYVEDYLILELTIPGEYTVADTMDSFDQLWSLNTTMVDLNLDGFMDLYSYPFCHLNDGQDVFISYPQDFNVVEYADYEIIDLNGDAFPDFVATRGANPSLSSAPNQLIYRPNQGDGTFGPELLLANHADMDHIEIFDSNLDGFPDIVYTYDNFDHEINRLENDGAGNFTAPFGIFGFNLMNLGPFTHFNVAVASNVPFDAQAIVVTDDFPNDEVYVKVNNDNTPNFLTAGTNIKGVHLFDISNDGLSDVLIDYLSEIVWYENNGNGTFSGPTLIESGLTNHLLELIDFDNDGYTDIVYESAAGQEISWFKNIGNGLFTSKIQIHESVFIGNPVLEVVDYDNDGDNDIVYNHQDGTAELVVLYNENSVGSAMNPMVYNESTCDDLVWSFNSQLYNVEGVYVDSTQNVSGCDSVAILNLVIDIDSVALNVSTCNDYYWPETGITYTNSGLYSTTLVNSNGCDSIVDLSLTIHNPDSSWMSITECMSYTWPENNQTYSSSGQYSEVYMNQFGCDSVVLLDLVIGTPQNTTQDVYSCEDSYYWPVTGQTYNQDGAYTATLQSVAGCDSVVTLNLDIVWTASPSWTATACNEYYWHFNGQTYTSSGVFVDTLPSIYGCDSIGTLNLTIDFFDVSVTQLYDTTLMANNAPAQYMWFDCDEVAPVSLSSDQSFTPSANGWYAVIVWDPTCLDTSDCYLIDYYSGVGLEELEQSELVLFPNPTEDELMVQINSIEGAVSIEVYDVSGRLVLSQKSLMENETVVDVSALTSGVYHLIVASEGIELRSPFVKR